MVAALLYSGITKLRARGMPHYQRSSGRPCGRVGHGIEARIASEREREEDGGQLVTLAVVAGLVHAGAADVGERDRHDHAERVLDSPEPGHRVLHRAAEVLECALRDRAEHPVEQEAEQELQVEGHGEPEARPARPAASTAGGTASPRCHGPRPGGPS